MTAREYLSQVNRLERQIQIKDNELSFWRSKIGSVQSASYSEMPPTPSINTTPSFVHVIEKIDELEREMDKLIDRLVDLKTEVTAVIEQLESQDEQEVLKYRYIEGMRLSEISAVMYYSLSSVKRLHRSALEHIQALTPREPL